MLKKNAQPLSEVLSDFFDENSTLKMKMAEHRVLRGWREVLGEGVSKYTREVYLNRNVLYVHLSSAVLRAELLMNKDGLIKKLNDHAEMPIVRDIVFR
jgi:predicted nucleic acid-binding Zn ribbon protein